MVCFVANSNTTFQPFDYINNVAFVGTGVSSRLTGISPGRKEFFSRAIYTV